MYEYAVESVKFSNCQIFPEFNVPKIIKIG